MMQAVVSSTALGHVGRLKTVRIVGLGSAGLV
jgi:hypothetical protein